MELKWEKGFEISLGIRGEEVCLSANEAGLRSLAAHLLALAAEPEGAHLHLDAYNSLEEGSAALIVEKTESR